jgi:hypothetical protein
MIPPRGRRTYHKGMGVSTPIIRYGEFFHDTDSKTENSG